jgi:hypothetical protein
MAKKYVFSTNSAGRQANREFKADLKATLREQESGVRPLQPLQSERKQRG